MILFTALAPPTARARAEAPGAGKAGDVNDCLVCHADTTLTTERAGRVVSLHVDRAELEKSAHGGLVCGDCHAGLDPSALPHAARLKPVDCLSCHAQASQAHRFHARLPGMGYEATGASDCKSCHGTHRIEAPGAAGGGQIAPGGRGPGAGAACVGCHENAVREFRASAHGRAGAAGIKGAPHCRSCHDNPITTGASGGSSLKAKLAQEKLCLSCHRDDPGVRERMAPSRTFIAAYEKSVHGAALLAGNAAVANCVDCHGAHSMQRGGDPASRMSRQRMSASCARCHPRIASEYAASVHGAAVAKGSQDAPVCTSCHGEHEILAHTSPDSPVAAANVSARVCSPCHSSVRFSEKYEMARGRPETFAESYHGLALRGGSVEAANCASCHGAHDIRPSLDPDSSINAANLARTCGKCHAGANRKFAVGAVHVAVTAAQEPSLYWIAALYVGLIVVTSGFMLVHNALDFARRLRRRMRIRSGEVVAEPCGHALYLRMTLLERLQHGALMLSFGVLVVTGFMLRYPDAWWVSSLRGLSGRAFELRSLLHRAAGLLMIAASIGHVLYCALSARGRALVRDLLPRRQDLYDLRASLKYNLGLTAQRPLVGRFSYVEKSEYWALIWGTGVMAATGLVMWFENFSIGLLTKLGWDVARTIHFYEAWLAMLAIVIWHLYAVIFNPDVYPMNAAWLSGTLTEAEMREDHPLELEAILRARAREEEREAASFAAGAAGVTGAAGAGCAGCVAREACEADADDEGRADDQQRTTVPDADEVEGVEGVESAACAACMACAASADDVTAARRVAGAAGVVGAEDMAGAEGEEGEYERREESESGEEVGPGSAGDGRGREDRPGGKDGPAAPGGRGSEEETPRGPDASGWVLPKEIDEFPEAAGVGSKRHAARGA